jgi:hypothetical protein
MAQFDAARLFGPWSTPASILGLLNLNRSLSSATQPVRPSCSRRRDGLGLSRACPQWSCVDEPRASWVGTAAAQTSRNARFKHLRRAVAGSDWAPSGPSATQLLRVAAQSPRQEQQHHPENERVAANQPHNRQSARAGRHDRARPKITERTLRVCHARIARGPHRSCAAPLATRFPRDARTSRSC